MKYNFYLFMLIVLLFNSCTEHDDGNEDDPGLNSEDEFSHIEIMNQLKSGYSLMPEQIITYDSISEVYAQYTNPVTKYNHGILGDAIEAGQLVVVHNDVFYKVLLDSAYVFEDIAPRLADVDNDNLPEIITLRTHINLGAGIAIYKINENMIKEYAYLPEIGTVYRWLNIAAIYDMDNDGTVEIAWIETPHIGGTLKISRILKGELVVIDERAQYSNHKIGETNLCMSVLVQHNDSNILYVPHQVGKKVTGFMFQDDQLIITNELNFSVDYSKALKEQYEFPGLIQSHIEFCQVSSP